MPPHRFEHLNQGRLRRLLRREEDQFHGRGLCAKKMALEPRQHRRLIERQRLGVVKMAARRLAGRPAGVKDPRPPAWRDAGNLEFPERAGGQGGYLAPMPDRIRLHVSPVAKLPVNGHRLALQGEERQRQPVEFRPPLSQDIRRHALAQEGTELPGEFFQNSGQMTLPLSKVHPDAKTIAPIRQQQRPGMDRRKEPPRRRAHLSF